MERLFQPIDRAVAVVCPRCGSSPCQLRPIAQVAGLMIGGVVGAIVAVCLNTNATSTHNGGGVGQVGNRRLSVMSAGVISRAFVGFGSGAVAGQAAGADVDEKIIRAYHCHDCGLEF